MGVFSEESGDIPSRAERAKSFSCEISAFRKPSVKMVAAASHCLTCDPGRYQKWVAFDAINEGGTARIDSRPLGAGVFYCQDGTFLQPEKH